MKPTAETTAIQLTTINDWRLAIVAASEFSASVLDRSWDWRVNPAGLFGPPQLRRRRRESGSYPWPRSRRSRKVALAASS